MLGEELNGGREASLRKISGHREARRAENQNIAVKEAECCREHEDHPDKDVKEGKEVRKGQTIAFRVHQLLTCR